jgi:hypothetical protein
VTTDVCGLAELAHHHNEADHRQNVLHNSSPDGEVPSLHSPLWSAVHARIQQKKPTGIGDAARTFSTLSAVITFVLSSITISVCFVDCRSRTEGGAFDRKVGEDGIGVLLRVDACCIASSPQMEKGTAGLF